MDINRYLSHEPIVARPREYLSLPKLIRRNKAAFAAITSIAAVLVIGSS